MIVVKIEIWPFGSESNKREAGRMYLFNDGTGTEKRGNYNVRVCRKGKYEPDREMIHEGKGCTRTGKVSNYPRISYNIWRLITKALKSAFPEEN